MSRSLPSQHDTILNVRKYNDPEFPPVPENIIKYNERTWSDGLELGTFVARWLRPEHIRWSNTSENYLISVFNHPHPLDIVQGRLGNCWFVSALSLVAEIPQILEKIMITKQRNPYGLYSIRLCNRGVWQVITIDDMLPVTQENTLVFTRSHKKQLFASLIEKALAKMHGSYGALESGRCVAGLQTLTGEPCEILLLRSTDPKKVSDLNYIWTRIIQSRMKGYLMTCLSSNKDVDEQVFHQMGLESDHAYSILDVRQIGSQRVLRLRNPWGRKGGNDLFTNNSTKSSNIATVQSVSSSENDGVFWMPWEQMSSFFSDITICKINTHGYKARKRGQFGDFSTTIRSVYSLDCPNGAELEIELFNADDGKHFNNSKDVDIDLFLILLSSNGSCQAYKHGLDYYITLSTTVPSGRYLLLAGSMSVVNYSIRPMFNLVVHSSQSFNINEQPSSRDFVGNAFHAAALKANSRKDFGDGVSILTLNDNGAFAFICENKSNRMIRLKTDFQGSMNAFSSRKAFHMVDIIPARTKQLFAMFTRITLSRDVNIVYQLEYQALTQSHSVHDTHSRNNPPIHPQTQGLHILKTIH